MEQETIGTRIIERAAKHPKFANLSRKELAEAFGVSYEALRKWISGTTRPSRKHEEHIAMLLGALPETFTHGVEYLETDDQGEPLVQEVDRKGKHSYLAQPVSRNSVTVDTPSNLQTVNWRDGAMVSSQKRFVVVAPDDSMEPIILKGSRVILDRTLTARNKDIVLIEDSAGEWYLRTYRQAPNARWGAKAENTDYDPMDSERDGLRVLAVFDGYHGRRG